MSDCEGLPTGKKALVHMCIHLCSSEIYEEHYKLFGFVCVCCREGGSLLARLVLVYKPSTGTAHPASIQLQRGAGSVLGPYMENLERIPSGFINNNADRLCRIRDM